MTFEDKSFKELMEEANKNPITHVSGDIVRGDMEVRTDWNHEVIVRGHKVTYVFDLQTGQTRRNPDYGSSGVRRVR